TAAPANGRTVLTVEDDAHDRQWLASTLTAAGYSVEAAANGDEALRLLNERQFSAVILDLMLPDMSGWEVLRRTREGINRDVPVVVVSVLADQGGSVGFAIRDFLEKPVSGQDLLD